MTMRDELPDPFEFLALPEDEEGFFAELLHADRLGRLLDVREVVDNDGTRTRVFLTRNATLTGEELDAVVEDVRAEASDALALAPDELLAELEEPAGKLRLALARIGILEDELTRKLLHALDVGHEPGTLEALDAGLEHLQQLRVVLEGKLERLEAFGGEGDDE
jgi:hypothetical protein